MTTTQRELLVGAYCRRSDSASVRVVRVEGTRTFRAYVNGQLTTEGTRAAALKEATR